ncbi:hypothetical protein HNR23_003913 [Nocardiopsis mwathae]|uniref:ESX-1 secretion-associated protein n=1 Tax=Nocardiopsis mwathae TaxID=1472723 RepID=A0A7X0D6Y1_9ACTN|nr:hypothetical protein [Nocardiopsis mwathae]
MSSWDINPDGVGGVLKSVSGHLGDEAGTEGLTGEITAVGKNMETAAAKAASEPIGIALRGFFGFCSADMGAMAAKTASAVNGCSGAVVAYMNGNLEMAAEAQANAGFVEDPGLNRPKGAELR